MDRSLGSRYVLHEALGRGAMGEVFRGTVRESGAPVAVKVLKAELMSDREIVGRFVQERSILMSISDPSVVRVTDLVVEGETLGIVMELVAGGDLRDYLGRERTLAPATALRLFRQLLAGLAAVHAAGILHRDIKPENLLLDFRGEQPGVKLTDFGIARLSYGASPTKMTALIGTPEYMAPEIAEYGNATPASDLYSAGIVLYEMLAGRTPFGGGPPLAVLRRHAEQPLPPIPLLPARSWAYLESLLAKDPAARPRSAAQAAELLVTLEPELAGLRALPPAAAPAAEAGGRGRTSPGTGPDQAALATTSLVAGGAVPGHRENPSAREGRPRRSRLRSRRVVLPLAAAFAVLAAALSLAMTRLPAAAPRAPRPPLTASYAFPLQRYGNGLVIARRWTLSGKGGSVLTETITASSSTGKPMTIWFQDSIPEAITGTVRTVRFSPAPARVVRPDPVVAWRLRLPARGAVTVGYVAAVPPRGATAVRLADWARGLDALEQRLNKPAAKHPQPARTTPSPAGPPPAAPASSSPGAGNPNPYPTFSCDPALVTCSTAG